MNFLNTPYLGYASTPEEAIQILGKTGVFYISISIAYLLAYLYRLWHGSTQSKDSKKHLVQIFGWAFVGGSLLISPHFFSHFINELVCLWSFLVLSTLRFTGTLLNQATLSEAVETSEDKKTMYMKTMLTKMSYKFQEILECTILNEQILWLLIFFNSIVGIRASFGL